ncbi:uncharacterized protein PADG_12024 [Paracoccidioides brasiliensis Pb18]|uniref:Ankyrin repeat domain-containing protein n=1 Tax=Paracoccidioides brasiliensis (strain Pb18) TaxID=502780 RepID=A0A0A0HU82_PARBD|nr:uncharacterized protein PADG_12024 [Paracoccidioides brasiliensis Pb18]KGM91883.1 hypothetical protein PADG_12024 [Paracoccidioides brasiliensis Pb18]
MPRILSATSRSGWKQNPAIWTQSGSCWMTSVYLPTLNHPMDNSARGSRTQRSADIRSSHGCTALSFAAERGDEDAIRWLLAGGDVDPLSKITRAGRPSNNASIDFSPKRLRRYELSEERKAVIEMSQAITTQVSNIFMKH